AGALVQLTPAGEVLPGQKGTLDAMEGSLHARRAVRVPFLMRFEHKAISLCKGCHLRSGDNAGAASGGDDDVRVVDHAGGRGAMEVGNRLGQKGFALKAREARIDLEED